MSLPSMKEFKADYVTEMGVTYYDITNLYQTDPLEVIKSKIIFRLGTTKGEWYDDIDFGFPYISIRLNSTEPDAIAQLIGDEVLKVEGVTGVNVNNKEFNDATRVFTCSLSVFTIYGELSLERSV